MFEEAGLTLEMVIPGRVEGNPVIAGASGRFACPAAHQLFTARFAEERKGR
jgi:hypothetical protein